MRVLVPGAIYTHVLEVVLLRITGNSPDSITEIPHP
jgi:hypothetical protein